MICERYLTDDLRFKHDFKTVGDSLPQVLRFVLGHTGLQASLAERFRSVLTILRDGASIARARPSRSIRALPCWLRPSTCSTPPAAAKPP